MCFYNVGLAGLLLFHHLARGYFVAKYFDINVHNVVPLTYEIERGIQ